MVPLKLVQALQVQVLLHVLVKVKQRADGSFKVRTVTYAERPELAGKRTCICTQTRSLV